MTPFDAAITFCYVPDLGPSARFYEDVLGLPLVLDQGGCRIYRVKDGGYFAFCERDRGAPARDRAPDPGHRRRGRVARTARGGRHDRRSGAAAQPASTESPTPSTGIQPATGSRSSASTTRTGTARSTGRAPRGDYTPATGRRYDMTLGKKAAAEFFGTFWLVFGGCGSAVLAGVPNSVLVLASRSRSV